MNPLHFKPNGRAGGKGAARAMSMALKERPGARQRKRLTVTIERARGYLDGHGKETGAHLAGRTVGGWQTFA